MSCLTRGLRLTSKVALRHTGLSLARTAFARRAMSSAPAAGPAPLKTALYDYHVQLGGKMVPFAGYLLPVKYKDGDIESHLHCRKAASVFDVSHMGQLKLHGKDRLKFLETLVPSDLFALKLNQTRLSVLTNETGGTIDDCMITNATAAYSYMVVNAGCKDKDLAHMRQQLTRYKAANPSAADVAIEYIETRSLLALQGPQAAAVLKQLKPTLPGGSGTPLDVDNLEFMYHVPSVSVGGIADCYITRCGYTGEDGFEVSVPDSAAIALMQKMLAVQPTLAAGLGARDSLRLEAGLCLYGHELNETISPVEADLKWLIGKRRREQGGFLGHSVIAQQFTAGATRKRVGLTIAKGAPAREGVEIRDAAGTTKIGEVTSGTFSPSLKKPVSMGYVSTAHSKPGTTVQLIVRGKPQEATVSNLPFVPSSYYKSPAAIAAAAAAAAKKGATKKSA